MKCVNLITREAFLLEEYQIIKVLNNNVLLVDSQCIQYILVGKGIGFGKKSGETIKDFSGIESKFISLQD